MDWSDRDTDRFMDMVLSGNDAYDIARAVGKSPSEVRSHFQEAFYPIDYEPSMPRIWRGGKKMTELEKRLIRKHLKRKTPVKIIARILQRKPDEILPDLKGEAKSHSMRTVAKDADVLAAHHYLFHQSKRPIISDQAYDSLKAAELEFGNGAELLKMISEAKGVVDYPPHIRSLANYMLYKFMEETGEWNNDKLPYSWSKEKKLIG